MEALNESGQRKLRGTLKEMECFFLEAAFFRILCACHCPLPNLQIYANGGVLWSCATQ
jgi:hypothetical protein